MGRGVPQGSILAPLLFLIYINDINQVIQNRLVLFADDTTTLVSNKNLQTMKAEVEQGLADLESWFTANKLKLNMDKTEKMIISLRRHDEPNPQQIKFLGVFLDPKLTFKAHIENTAKKLAKTIFLIRNL